MPIVTNAINNDFLRVPRKILSGRGHLFMEIDVRTDKQKNKFQVIAKAGNGKF